MHCMHAMLDVPEVTGGLRGCWGVIGRDLIRRAGPPVKISRRGVIRGGKTLVSVKVRRSLPMSLVLLLEDVNFHQNVLASFEG